MLSINFITPENFTHVESTFVNELIFDEKSLDWLNNQLDCSIKQSEDEGRQIFEVANAIRLEVLESSRDEIQEETAKAIFQATIDSQIDLYKICKAFVQEYKTNRKAA